MKTAVQDTSISNYYTRVVPDLQDKQEQRIVAFISAHGPSTIGEIASGLGMEKLTVSARQNKLRKDGVLIFGDRRKCKESHVTCKPLKLHPGQVELFQ